MVCFCLFLFPSRKVVYVDDRIRAQELWRRSAAGFTIAVLPSSLSIFRHVIPSFLLPFFAQTVQGSAKGLYPAQLAKIMVKICFYSHARSEMRVSKSILTARSEDWDQY